MSSNSLPRFASCSHEVAQHLTSTTPFPKDPIIDVEDLTSIEPRVQQRNGATCSYWDADSFKDRQDELEKVVMTLSIAGGEYFGVRLQ